MKMKFIYIIYEILVIDPAWRQSAKMTIWKYLVFFCPLVQYLELQMEKEDYIYSVESINVIYVIIHKL